MCFLLLLVPQTNVIIEICHVLLFTLYNTMEELIFYADQIMVMGSSKNVHVFLISRFYSNRKNRENLMLAKYTCFTAFSFVLQYIEPRLLQISK